jgi:hypothetical protein
MQKELNRGRKPPDVYVRAHHHAYDHAYHEIKSEEEGRGKVYCSHIYIVPARCGLSEYAQKGTQSEYLITDGCIAFEVESGKVTAHPLWRETDLRTEEAL